MISIRYFEPPAALRQHVSSLYWFETAAPGFADLMRAELGQIRLLIDGVGRTQYKSGRQWASGGAILQGPTTAPTHYTADTRLRLFGIGLLPLGWAELIGLSADELADNAVGLDSVLPPAIVASLMDALASAVDDQSRFDVIINFLTTQLAANRHPACWFTRLADEWLTASPNPQVDALVAAAGMSSRSVERLTHRLYGASPKLLARKYRALGAAVRLGLGEATTWSEAAGDAFYDQAHFIREFRAFTGLTPAKFQAQAAPLTSITMTQRRQLPGLPNLVRIA
ncbi:AraC family transcriptional regulator [Sandarakinorhabdus sp. AAP62]|uniref:helix-turn-helix domain-containing protein n=1 Tax=Sandarakinorhabdus sp. AAP62 TaxID=1248916 RepID=UPI0003154637|nr:AraC family transcriptional regulator [Sandarakinorhabdus sp. AAP62]